MLYLRHKRETASGYPANINSYYYKQSSTIRGSRRLSSFSLENLITKTYKGNNEYTKLNHIRICNHRIALLSFVWRVFLSLRSWRVAACFWFPCPYHNTALPNRQLYYSHQYNSILPSLYLASVISVPLFPLFFLQYP